MDYHPDNLLGLFNPVNTVAFDLTVFIRKGGG